METITKENITNFLDYYHGFHDSTITSFNYNVMKSSIEIKIDVY